MFPHALSYPLLLGPKSYLELITAFKTALAAKRDEISAAKKRYEVGLEKLAFATESVNAMQVRLDPDRSNNLEDSSSKRF